MQVSDCAEWYYEPEFDELDGKNFDVVILAREITEDECLVLQRYTKAHGLFGYDHRAGQRQGERRGQPR